MKELRMRMIRSDWSLLEQLAKHHFVDQNTVVRMLIRKAAKEAGFKVEQSKEGVHECES